jgi:hypothetical protein
MADTTLIIGLAGIGGAVFAGSLGPLTQLGLDRLHRRDRTRSSASQVLRAVRMIDLELGAAQAALIQAIITRSWLAVDWSPRFDLWDRFAADIAGEVSPGCWRALVHAHHELWRIHWMYDAFGSVDGQRNPEDFPFDDKLADDLRKVIDVILVARVHLRPTPLGGSSFSAFVPDETRPFWFPETPELAPSRKRARRRWLRSLDDYDPPSEVDADSGGKYAPMPYGLIFVDRSELDDVSPDDEPRASS